MLQCVALWCSVLQCVALCYSVLQCVAVYVFLARLPSSGGIHSELQGVAVCCSVLQCVAVFCSVNILGNSAEEVQVTGEAGGTWHSCSKACNVWEYVWVY